MENEVMVKTRERSKLSSSPARRLSGVVELGPKHNGAVRTPRLCGRDKAREALETPSTGLTLALAVLSS
jgi:hypothetical protein